MYKLAFIGGGKMAEALLQGVLNSRLLEPKEIIVTDILAERLEYLQQKYQVITSINNLQAIQNTQNILLAVKPQQINPVLAEIHSLVKGQIIISIVAGITIEKISGNYHLPVARAMPNTPALIGQGMTAIAFSPDFPNDRKSFVLELFNAVGQTIELPENKLNAVTALSGSGPAFIFRLIDYFSKAGEKLGLTKETALFLAKQTFLGSATLAIKSNNNLEQLIEQVTSPKGTTAAGREVFESSDVAQVIENTLQAAAKRAEELSKGL